jgi:predicted nucleotidyltransferase
MSVESGITGGLGIVEAVLRRFPDAQAVYLFGSRGSEEERPESDIDIALLLPPRKVVEAGALDDLRFELESIHQKDVDLINLRMASTVLQKEVVAACRRIYCADKYAADEFEMLTISLYQKLNEERAGILQAAAAGGRFYGK